MWLKIILLLLAYVVNIRTSEPQRCLASQHTLCRVPSCPKNREEWEKRSDAKGCFQVQQNCIEPNKFVYHCVINSYVNETLEVCAPAKKLIGHRCVEFNKHGGRIQESTEVLCNYSSSPCPFKYMSTDVYKYQQCFQAIGSSESNPVRHPHEYLTMDSNKSSCIESCCDTCNNGERDWQIVAAVMIIINVALFVTTLLMVISKLTRRRTCNKDEEKKKSETEALIPVENRKRTNDEGEQSSNKDNEGKKKSETEAPIPVGKNRKRTNDKGKQSSNKDPFYVAALDIGDTYFTIALSRPESPERVEPLEPQGRMSLLMDKKRFISFGTDAMDDYMRLKGDDYFHDFKLSKHPTCSLPSEAYDHVVSALREKIRFALKSNGIDIKSTNIHHVFIVPTYWTKEDINKLEKSSQKKEVDHELCHTCVIRREKAISPFIHEVNARVLCLNFNVDNLVFKSGKQTTYYAILHIGSSYYDLMLWPIGKGSKITIKDKMEWTEPPQERMLKKIQNIYCIEDDDLKDWKAKEKRDYIKFLDQFEKLQKHRREHKDDIPFPGEVPTSLISLAKGGSTSAIEENFKGKGITVKGDKGCNIDIEFEFYRECFDKMNEDVSKLITEKETVSKFIACNVKCVVMTGSYTHEEIVRRAAEEKWFKGKQITVAIPENAHVFAMGGAYYKYQAIQKSEEK